MDSTLEMEIRELRERLGSDEDSEERVFAHLADALRRAGRLDEAREVLAEGRTGHPDFSPGHVVAGRVARAVGEAKEAEDAYRRALELDSGNIAALNELAELLGDEGRPLEAADLLHRLWWLEPDEAVRDRLRSAKRSWVERELEQGAESEPTAGARRDADSGGEEREREEEGSEAGGDFVVTRTVAELYARQGHVERAIRVFERLAETDPDDEGLRERLEELRQRTKAADESTTEEAGEEEAGEMERLAREWARGPDEIGELGTPFAWTEAEEEGRGGEAAGPAPTIGDHFRRVLGWRSAGPAEPADEGGSPERLAESEAPVSTESLELSPVPIEELAPEPVPVEELGPDAPVPIGSLAPDAPPEAAEEETEPTKPGSPEPGEPPPESAASSPPDRDDEFRRWLDELGP